MRVGRKRRGRLGAVGNTCRERGGEQRIERKRGGYRDRGEDTEMKGRI